ncbi:MAG: 23S rRNA (adenine(2503)-C(2))-methyltransferase RlmN [Oscillospiraceae bacterium]|nr:23S rRNA (adenine(2503)-C(2))-methyltransferase RlmN [Oscillospiraceae bacterium]
MDNKTDILSLSRNELKELLETGFAMKGFRADQIYSWLYKPGEQSGFAKMSDIPKAHQKILEDNFHIGKLNMIKKRISADGTVKYLFALHDKEMIESVFMRYNHGNTVCISTQAGCRMGCVFCASGAGGFARNLLPSEMLLQVLAAGEDIKERISNVVLMGIGEPLDNFENVVKFLELANCKKGLNIGYRHISLSTCGLVDKISKLGEINIPITLSVSLHASDDETRKKIMPAAAKWKIDDLLQACREYANATKRRISFEYALMDKINDSKEDARKLALKIKNILCHVNLIPVNEVYGKEFKPPSGGKAKIFQKTLEDHGINATFRRKCGKDIDASCGQLKFLKTKNEV